MMRKLQTLLLTIGAFILLAASAAASDWVTIAAGFDSGGNAITRYSAVPAYYMQGNLVDTDISILSDGAAEYGVLLDGMYYSMELYSTNEDLGIAQFAITDSAYTGNVPYADTTTAGEQLTIYYLTPSAEEQTCLVSFTDCTKSGNVYIYKYQLLGTLADSYVLPMTVMDDGGFVVGYISPSGDVYSYLFDEDEFNQGGGSTGTNGDSGGSGGSSGSDSGSGSGGSSGSDSGSGSGGSSGSDSGSDSSGGQGGRRETVDEPTDNRSLIIGGILLLGVSAAGVIFFISRMARKGQGGAKAGMGQIPEQHFAAGSNVPQTPPVVNAAPPPVVNAAPPPVVNVTPQPVVNAAPQPVPERPGAQRVTPVLYGEGGEMDGRRYALTQPSISIGRNQTCTISYRPDTEGISREHCVLTWRNGVLMLEDRQSSCGTFLRGAGRLTPNQPVALKSGDVFYLGEKKNSFRLNFE